MTKDRKRGNKEVKKPKAIKAPAAELIAEKAPPAAGAKKKP